MHQPSCLAINWPRTPKRIDKVRGTNKQILKDEVRGFEERSDGDSRGKIPVRRQSKFRKKKVSHCPAGVARTNFLTESH